MDRFYNADIDIFLHKAFMNLTYEQYQDKSRNNNKKKLWNTIVCSNLENITYSIYEIL